MLNKKKILFLTGTRADFGKLKSLMKKVEDSDLFELYIFVTGMHMMSKYGLTSIEVESSGFSNVYKYINQNLNDSMDVVLAKTVLGLGDYVKELNPDLIVVHGDRVEAMAGAIVGSLNNILVGHVEGGEVSGTIDELIRHSVSKMAHIHFVSNELARKRLLQLGELESSIFIIGSPDLDIMVSKKLPSIECVLEKYQIPFNDYAVLMYHPVTTELDGLKAEISAVVDAVIESNKNYVVVYPNNDHGTDVILNEYKRLDGNQRVRIFPSIRFEYFLVLLKFCKFMIGNSSAGVREAPFYGLPSINIGSRQNNRSTSESVINASGDSRVIFNAIKQVENMSCKPYREFGEGNSDQLFIDVLGSPSLWCISQQKLFNDFEVRE
ncbi:MAG: UDP-N-acetylglucosamine 2-epimerase (hydrolyzing) [Bermanella sp.]